VKQKRRVRKERAKRTNKHKEEIKIRAARKKAHPRSPIITRDREQTRTAPPGAENAANERVCYLREGGASLDDKRRGKIGDREGCKIWRKKRVDKNDLKRKEGGACRSVGASLAGSATAR